MALVAVVVAVSGAGLLLGGTDDGREVPADEERDDLDGVDLDEATASTTRGSTTTISTSRPLGPVFGEPIEGALLVHRAGEAWTRLDLTTGALEPLTLPDVDLFNAEAMPGGIVVAAGEEVRYYAVLGDDLEPVGTLLGKGNEVVRAGGDRLWLFDQPGGGDEVHTHARLVDLEGNVLRELEIPGYQAYATPGEVLVARGGRVYVVEDRGYRPLATGHVYGVVGDNVLIASCDDEGGCTLLLQPTDGGPGRSLVTIDDPDAARYAPLAAASDGRLAIVAEGTTGDRELLVFDRRGGLLAEVRAPVGMQSSSSQWLPGERGLLTGTADGLQWIRPRGDEWGVEDLDIGALGSPRTFFFVTP